MTPETRAWGLLLALSAASTALAALHPLPPGASVHIANAALLLLALIKARVILARYLDLAAAPGWLRGFSAVLAGYMAVMLALALVA